MSQGRGELVISRIEALQAALEQFRTERLGMVEHRGNDFLLARAWVQELSKSGLRAADALHLDALHLDALHLAVAHRHGLTLVSADRILVTAAHSCKSGLSWWPAKRASGECVTNDEAPDADPDPYSHMINSYQPSIHHFALEGTRPS